MGGFKNLFFLFSCFVSMIVRFNMVFGKKVVDSLQQNLQWDYDWVMSWKYSWGVGFGFFIVFNKIFYIDRNVFKLVKLED